jgi:hypothetical protein
VKRAAVVLFLLASTAHAWAAGGSCQERCMTNFTRCTGSCNTPERCMKRCQDQLDSCNRSCAKEDADAKPVMPKKCPDAKGRLKPCSEQHNDPNGLDTPPPVPRH